MTNSAPQTKYKTWKRLGSKTVFKGRVNIIEYDVELPNGEKSTYQVDHARTFAVATLIKTADNKIILTYQYRFPLDRWIYDLPGGGAHVGETHEQAAIRECREEVGIAPKHLTKLATFYPNPARVDWSANIFYCETFESSKLKIDDPSENVKKILIPADELKRLIENQEIVDPSLLIAWYAARDKGFIKAD